jgi:IS30 family transposase
MRSIARRLGRSPSTISRETGRFVSDKPGVDWSPDQITGHLRKHHEPGAGMQASHETI